MGEVRVYAMNDRRKGFAVVFWDTQNAGAYDRFFRGKGISSTRFAKREMTKEEEDWWAKCTRLRFVPYKDWKTLIADEWRQTENEDWCKILLKESRLKCSLEEIKRVA